MLNLFKSKEEKAKELEVYLKSMRKTVQEYKTGTEQFRVTTDGEVWGFQKLRSNPHKESGWENEWSSYAISFDSEKEALEFLVEAINRDIEYHKNKNRKWQVV